MGKPTEPTAAGALVRDAELAAMNSIGKQLNALDPAQRRRVLAWVTDRWIRSGHIDDPGAAQADTWKPIEAK